ncbi:MAG: 2-C-methyl-D-erythritol 4-phosphate cytidylyltransferase [bacterium]
MKTTAIITAGGSGKRFMSDIPKQYHLLEGVPIIVRTIQQFELSPVISDIVLSVAPDFIPLINQYIIDYQLEKITEIVSSGRERQDSVFNALQTKTVYESDVIMIHDAVRPFVTQKLIQSLFDATMLYGAVFPGLRPKETIKQLHTDGMVAKTLDRDSLVAVQTPESFKKDIIIKAFSTANEFGFIGTDSSSLVENIGIDVHFIAGEENNIKITTLIDFTIAKTILENL